MMMMLGVLLGVLVGAPVAWFGRGKMHARAARPHVMMSGNDIIVTNTLDEQIDLVQIDANSDFALDFRRPGGGSEAEAAAWFRSREGNWPVSPGGEARLQILFKQPDRPRVLHLRFTSARGTLKRESVRLET